MGSEDFCAEKICLLFFHWIKEELKFVYKMVTMFVRRFIWMLWEQAFQCSDTSGITATQHFIKFLIVVINHDMNVLIPETDSTRQYTNFLWAICKSNYVFYQSSEKNSRVVESLSFIKSKHTVSVNTFFPLFVNIPPT